MWILHAGNSPVYVQEYEFTPKSKLMTVQEGREEIVEIVATRVAHSLYGTLSGLKGIYYAKYYGTWG